MSLTQTHPDFLSFPQAHSHTHTHTHTRAHSHTGLLDIHIVQYGRQWTGFLQFVLSALCLNRTVTSILAPIHTHSVTYDGMNTQSLKTNNFLAYTLYFKQTHTHRQTKALLFC